jgi:hypothetical protein
VSEPRDVLLSKVLNVEATLQDLADDGLLEGIGPIYRERLLLAAAEGAEQLALASTGDEQATEELKLIAARIALWTYAGAEHARQALVRAWRKWLFEATEALAELAIPILELGFKALVESGLQAIAD